MHITSVLGPVLAGGLPKSLINNQFGISSLNWALDATVCSKLRQVVTALVVSMAVILAAMVPDMVTVILMPIVAAIVIIIMA